MFGRGQFITAVIWLCASSIACAHSASNASEGYLGASFFTDKYGENWGMAVSVTGWDGPVGFRIGLAGLDFPKMETEDWGYSGFDGAILLGYGDILRPYIGVGLFAGSTDWGCDEESDYEEDYRSRHSYSHYEDDCDDEQTLFSAYPEIGVALNLGRLQIAPFGRLYYDSNHNWTEVWGVSFSFRSDP